MTPTPAKDKYTQIARVATAVVFAVVVTMLLATAHADYMYTLEGLNFFNFSGQWWHECMQRAGGLITWVSTGLTCTLGAGWPGACVYALVLTLLWRAVSAALRLPCRWRPAMAVVPALALVYLLGLGYAAFSMKAPGFAYSLPVGLLCSAALTGCYTRLRGAVARCALSAAIACCYPLLGVFALLAAALCAGYSLGSAWRGRKDGWKAVGARWLAPAVIALGAAGAVPPLWYRFFGDHLPLGQIWYTPLPRFGEGEESLVLPVKIIFALLVGAAVLLPALTGNAQGKQQGKTANSGETARRVPWAAALSLAVWAVAVALPLIAVEGDANFDLTLRMRRHLAAGEWQQALDSHKTLQEEPTRLNVAMAYAAALHQGTEASALFSMPVGSALYRGVRTDRVMHEIGAPLLSYHLGLTRFAYRWAMEDMVEYGRNADNLSLLARCSLIHGENALALKYIDALASIPGHGTEATALRDIAEGRKDLAEDPELAFIARLEDGRDTFNTDSGYFEGYIWPFLSAYDQWPATPEKQRLTMMAALVLQDQDALMAALPHCAAEGSRLPRLWAEAVLLHDASKGTRLADRYVIDESVRQAFDRFADIYGRNKGYGAEVLARALRSGFADTYWYYYFCVQNLDII